MLLQFLSAYAVCTCLRQPIVAALRSYGPSGHPLTSLNQAGDSRVNKNFSGACAEVPPATYRARYQG